MLKLFEVPVLSGWIYPCSLDQISSKLASLSENDLQDLWAVGLVPSTRKDNRANGRYIPGNKPTICIYSFPDSFTYCLPSNIKKTDVERWYSVEREYGMEIVEDNNRWKMVWTPEDLNRFTINHVLMHEVGHHVHCLERIRQGFRNPVDTRTSEQFAENYAKRHCRS